eukprot:TRINITY_DN33290_c0_g1_i1.p1 TRINITY_DN33290_c0_g1~~TRINITY_DN33290_c0_g1_i1.p1  ORF type:complete len:216 (-),score=64.22 TRINITY_DN33290_c0_g1_i1:194-841(-)
MAVSPATAGAADTGAYAAFVALPGAGALRMPGDPGLATAGGSSSSSLAAHLAAAGSRPARSSRAQALSRASQLIEDNTKWETAEANAAAERYQRLEVMRVALGADSAPKTTPEVSRPSPPAAAAASEATLEFHMPDWSKKAQRFQMTQSAFDVYAKCFELLENKERVFTMILRGPRDGPMSGKINKKIEDSAWSQSLKDFGLEAGQTYNVDVSQR